jgi:hypothetical protein
MKAILMRQPRCRGHSRNPQDRARIAQIWRPPSERAETFQVWSLEQSRYTVEVTHLKELEQFRYRGHPLERAGTVQVRRLPTRETSISSAIEDLFITVDLCISLYVCVCLYSWALSSKSLNLYH